MGSMTYGVAVEEVDDTSTSSDDGDASGSVDNGLVIRSP